jgi:hypothetical protein
VGCIESEGCNSSNYATMETVIKNLNAAGIVVVSSSEIVDLIVQPLIPLQVFLLIVLLLDLLPIPMKYHLLVVEGLLLFIHAMK